MTTNVVSEVTIQLPIFVAIAQQVLPLFLEAIQGELMTFKELRYSPDTREMRHAPPKSEVVFDGYGNSSVTFHLKYRSGEEGTCGEVDEIESIILRLGDRHFVFDYFEHSCGCRYCHGMKYPFRPQDIPLYSFENYSEAARLLAIRQYVGGVH